MVELERKNQKGLELNFGVSIMLSKKQEVVATYSYPGSILGSPGVEENARIGQHVI
jgi:hypothetical protein